ncbi:2'-O-glycosyltransferase CruG [Synechocystis sp. LKSZ1]|uniref:2'-O-glycosyltransferase CruG n=1 Tax=Synechocystis sp. LKSZ1 TaxID=3144951 RepID=UPI00336C2EB0
MLELALACSLLLSLQGPATLVLMSRLLKGANRQRPLEPQIARPEQAGQVSIVVPTLNEAERIGPCLQGLYQQDTIVREILVVDSRSQDGTGDKVLQMAAQDQRFHLLTDNPLPPGWVGRPWALNYGFEQSSPDSKWILGIDADTQPQPGLVAAVVQAAETHGYDLLSLSPQFILKTADEWWLQPALLMTLLYRFDSSGVRQSDPERVMANGQCFLCRRAVLEKLGGYQSAARSFCDDVTLARYAAQQGFRVGFFDGAKVIRVRMYEGFGETWREWGRSLDLKDATTPTQLWGDVALLVLVQCLPGLLVPVLALAWGLGFDFLTLQGALALNLALVAIRFALLVAIRPSYYRAPGEATGAWAFWLSPFADVLAVIRIILSAQKQPKQWRGRTY